ncbi:MAG: ATP-binding cassette domain-containing protein [Acutalibacteraceae bacterium]
MISFKNVYYTYDKSDSFSLSNINFTVNKGEILGIIGKSGSGKSTIVSLLSGLLKPFHGDVFLGNKSILNLKNDLYSKIGILFQYPEKQLFSKTIYDDIAFGLRNKNTDEKIIKKRILETIEFLNIDETLLDKSHLNLSGGEKRKCALAGILVTRPQVLILDEFTAGLDAASATKLIRYIKIYKKKENATVIFVSHVMEDVAYLSDKILILDKGKQITFGNSKEIFKQDKKLFKLGLDIPDTTKIINEINKRGYQIPFEIQKEKFKSIILEYLKNAEV